MTAAVVHGVVGRSGLLEIGIASYRYAANGQGGALMFTLAELDNVIPLVRAIVTPTPQYA